ncbi:unnamed protein product [Acanthoscelides obtectus]|uniref:Uncharacterized protein n=1 Tax=Acanthoscelides obtectus TaxID=200917 RepID=A0A9P0Q3W3_ACAOB|nr:unnamed protein product [Acanthoscelides obtectus]CAK1663629.1 hypothetical protein AOBTE_LOCUS23756 [Acanthoscelides obtectus]
MKAYVANCSDSEEAVKHVIIDSSTLRDDEHQPKELKTKLVCWW